MEAAFVCFRTTSFLLAMDGECHFMDAIQLFQSKISWSFFLEYETDQLVTWKCKCLLLHIFKAMKLSFDAKMVWIPSTQCMCRRHVCRKVIFTRLCLLMLARCLCPGLSNIQFYCFSSTLSSDCFVCVLVRGRVIHNTIYCHHTIISVS